MKTQKTITVTTDEENPIAVELVAEAIIAISDAMKKMKDSRLKRRAIILLIADNCASINRGYKRTIIGNKHIEAVLDSIDSLRDAYIKDVPKIK